MMRINENMLQGTAERVEKIQYNDPFIYPLVKPIVSGESYTFSFEGDLGEGLTQIRFYDSDPSVGNGNVDLDLMQVQGDRKFVTFVATDRDRKNIDFRIYFFPSDNTNLKWMAKVKLELGTEPSDIWTPAHADLTTEQIATLPPYGDYKEIKSF